MSGKSSRIAERVAAHQGGHWPACYRGYFDCFNQGLYFEAHDVLEELWLANGREAANHAYHKGLIQLAGAFVHLQKDRLGPAVALFGLAEANLLKYPRHHDGCDLTVLLALIHDWRSAILSGEPRRNPLSERTPPRLAPPVEPTGQSR